MDLARLDGREETAETRVQATNLSFGEVADSVEVLAGTGVIQNVGGDRYKMGAKLFDQWVVQDKKLGK